jgi:hypothetical protein
MVRWRAYRRKGPFLPVSHSEQPSAPQSREKIQGRLRNVTRAAVLAAAGATVGIGIVAAHDHPGASSAGTSTGTSQGSNSATTNDSSQSSTSNTGEGSSSSNTGSTGNTGSVSTAPSSSTATPTVTSGGTSR